MALTGAWHRDDQCRGHSGRAAEEPVTEVSFKGFDISDETCRMFPFTLKGEKLQMLSSSGQLQGWSPYPGQ